jgi:hypothetical protein
LSAEEERAVLAVTLRALLIAVERAERGGLADAATAAALLRGAGSATDAAGNSLASPAFTGVPAVPGAAAAAFAAPSAPTLVDATPVPADAAAVEAQLSVAAEARARAQLALLLGQPALASKLRAAQQRYVAGVRALTKQLENAEAGMETAHASGGLSVAAYTSRMRHLRAQTAAHAATLQSHLRLAIAELDAALPACAAAAAAVADAAAAAGVAVAAPSPVRPVASAPGVHAAALVTPLLGARGGGAGPPLAAGLTPATSLATTQVTMARMLMAHPLPPSPAVGALAGAVGFQPLSAVEPGVGAAGAGAGAPDASTTL